MKIKYILVDIDGTLTSVNTKHGLEKSYAEHFYDLIDSRPELPCDVCISKILPQYGIKIEDYTKKVLADMSQHTFIRPDAQSFLRWCVENRKNLYTATTNSKYISLLKLSCGGFKEEDFTGFFGGDVFNDPLGKFSPDFYPSILKALNSDGSDVVMIGDEWIRDSEPARKAGIKYTIHIDINAKEDCIEKEPGAFIVNSLEFAKDIIANA